MKHLEEMLTRLVNFANELGEGETISGVAVVVVHANAERIGCETMAVYQDGTGLAVLGGIDCLNTHVRDRLRGGR